MSVSVHSISMLYELRALRSRLQGILTVSRETLYLSERDLESIIWAIAVCEMLINKTERTGEYIASLESTVDAEATAEEAGLG